MSKASAQRPSAICHVIDGFELPATKRFALGGLVEFIEEQLGMRIFTTLFFLGLTSLTLSSCVTNGTNLFSALPSTFTTENVMQIHQGMSSDDILAMFGKPKSVEVTSCGRAPHNWTCTIWEYGEFPYDRALFYFGGKHDSLLLNSFDVDRD